MEATCVKCLEIFLPDDENDLIHAVTALGEECGGQGLVDLRTISVGATVNVVELHQRGVVLDCSECTHTRSQWGETPDYCSCGCNQSRDRS